MAATRSRLRRAWSRRPLLACVAAVLTAIAGTGLALGPGVGDASPTMTLGLAGPFSPASLRAASEAGVRTLLVEMTWREAEPTAGRYDTGYLDQVGDQVDRVRAAGFRVALNTGLQDAPAWVLDRPGGRFVDQDARTSPGSVPNLVFGTSLRPSAQDYLDHVLAAVGNQVALVRAGGGPSGELSYPYVFGPDGLVENRYWAFDDTAQRSNPVPGWKPGDPSPHGEATRFLDWYLDQLVGFQQWQVQALRTAGYRGEIAMLYPSSGMRPGDFARAVTGDLAGTTSPEVNGEVQRGYDFARQIAALTDPDVAVYGTWGENLGTVDYLAGLAHASGRAVMAENAGPLPPAQMNAALRNAAANGVAEFYLIRADDLMSGDHGMTDFADIGRSYRHLSES